MASMSPVLAHRRLRDIKRQLHLFRLAEILSELIKII